MSKNLPTFRVFSQSLSLMVLAFFNFSGFAQQPIYFQKPEALINCDVTDKIQEKILYEYGAVYLSKDAKLPSRCLFENETQIADFVKSFKIPANKFSFGTFYLQPKAKESLQKVFDELGGYKYVARNCNSKPADCSNGINNDWALRTYEQTQTNWDNNKNCEGKISRLNVAKTLAIDPIFNSALKYEEQKCSRPKLFQVAVPGSSQHHLGLAIDVNNGTGNSDVQDCQKKGDCRVCGSNCIKTLEKYGWFRTVTYDPYHFTFLGQGIKEEELRAMGLINVECKDKKKYWIPNATEEVYKGYKNWRCK